MSLVFSAIVPHPPILIPQIGKENLKRLAKTQTAYRKLAFKLAKSKPEVVIIISPHGIIQASAFTMNLNPEFTANFEEFGNFSEKLKIRGDVGLAHKIREKLETKTSLQLISKFELDHGTAVPLFLLTQKQLPNIKIIPIYYSELSLKEHFEFGKLLKHELQFNNENIAVIASGDLSHSLTKDSPATYSPKGMQFDHQLIKLLEKNKSRDILNLNPKLITAAQECGLKSITILLGILDGIKNKPELLSYEFPFGVGYLVMNFKL